MEFDSLDFTIDESTYCWSLSGEVSNRDEWVLAEPGLEIEVQIGADTYLFIIDSRERTESFGEQSFKVTARSKTSVFGVGSLPIHKTWGNTTAHDVINELIDDVNISIVNWNLPDGTLSSEGETAIAIVTKIATAAGGIVYTDSVGQLQVVPKYKVEPANYNLSNVDHIFSDMDDMFELTETKELAPGYNQVQISNEPESAENVIQISVHSKDLEALTAVLKVIIFPFVTEVTLLTSRNGVTINPSVTETEEFTETIEIINGVGQVPFPIESIVSSSYLDTDLGNLSTSGITINTIIKGTTLLEVTYITQYHLVSISADTAKIIQLYMEEL
ncbi:MAG: hypothetical protein B7C24_16585 [Bacteroidetes bacterium 4572_77]|nr:MAG: hypothetical protein B7C24_16585 [Bacteroidetes bacterium 4572_77]